MNEYLNPCYFLAETGTSRHVIVMHYDGDKLNAHTGNNLLQQVHTNTDLTLILTLTSTLRLTQVVQFDHPVPVHDRRCIGEFTTT